MSHDNKDFKDIEKRVACLCSNKSITDLGITSERIDTAPQATAVMSTIANMLGDLLEEQLQIDKSTIDEMKQIFLVLDSNA